MENLDLTAPDFKHVGASRGRPSARPGAALRQPGQAGQVELSPVAYQPPSPAGKPPSTTAQDHEDARSLLDRVVAAKGGLATLRGVKSITAVTHADTETPTGRVDAQTTTFLEYPNRVRVETRLPDQTIVQVYDGRRAWVKDARGTHDVPEPMARELDSSFKRDILALLVAAEGGTVQLRLLPDVKDDTGKALHAIEFSARDLEPTVLLIDPDTNLIARQTYAAGAGQPIVEESFSDYKAVSGVQIAFTAQVRQAGQSVLERHVTDITINAPLDPALFKRPS